MNYCSFILMSKENDFLRSSVNEGRWVKPGQSMWHLHPGFDHQYKMVFILWCFMSGAHKDSDRWTTDQKGLFILVTKHRFFYKFHFKGLLRACIWCHFLLATLAAAMTGDQQPLEQYVLLRNWGDFRWCYLTNLWIVKTNQWDLW